jgi:predicted regulator of Ras-like GTPase activity (Roadblock/LC7/MglB family)
MDAAQALADLVEISSQIDTAVVFETGGALRAGTPADESVGARLVETGRALLAAADKASVDRAASAGELTQVEVALKEGSVFLVREGKLGILATTGFDPTVGLVFYDLRTCLRAITGSPARARKPRPKEAGTGEA